MVVKDLWCGGMGDPIGQAVSQLTLNSMGGLLFYCSHPILLLQDAFEVTFKMAQQMNLSSPKFISSRRRTVDLDKGCDYNKHHDYLGDWRDHVR
jgi:hypothetical protein